MKIALDIRQERCQEITDLLASHGITVADDAELILSERNQHADYLRVRQDGEAYCLKVSEITAIESFGHKVEVRTESAVYHTADRLWQLEKSLDPAKVIRISNSVIVARGAIRHIRATLSSKFILTLSDISSPPVQRKLTPYSR